MKLENKKIEKVFCVSAKSGENVNNMFNYIVDGFFEFKYTLDNFKDSEINDMKFKKTTKKGKGGKKEKSEGCC
jgi:hypothetical protein